MTVYFIESSRATGDTEVGDDAAKAGVKVPEFKPSAPRAALNNGKPAQGKPRRQASTDI